MSKINIVVAAQTGGAIKGLNDVTAATRRTGAAVKKAQSGMGGFTKQVSSSQVKLRKFAMGGLQQAGYQIGDYAVQVANGTSKMQAFGQQAPQLLQIFGPIGAIVGAGVAIFAAFGVAIQKSGQEVTNLSSTLGVLQAPLMAVKESASSIKEAFGSALPAIAQNIDTALIAAGLFAAVVGVKMVRSMVMAAGAGSGLFGVMEALRLQQTLATMSNVRYTASMKLMTVATTVFKGVLSKLTMVFKRFLPIAVLLGVAKLIEMFLQLKEGAGSFGAALGLLKDVAVEAFGRIRLAFSTVPLAIKAGSASMASFFLQKLADMAASFVDFTADVADSLNSLFNTNLTPLGGNMAFEMRRVADAATEAATAASGELSEVASAVTAPLESLAVLRQSFRDGASDVTVFGAAGEKAAEGIGNAIKNKATKRIDEMKGLLNSVGQSFENAMMSAVDGTKSVKDAFKSMASEIIKELYRVFVVKRITGFITNAIGGYFNANQVSGPSMPLGTGNVRPVARTFDGGGYTGNGARAGGLDGKGGYMAMLHPRETVVDHTKGQGGGGVTVIQNNTFGNGVNRSEINAMLPKIVEASKAAVLDARRRGGSYAGAF